MSYWQPGTHYNAGDVVEYEGSRYQIIQPHRAQGDWAPNATPALWGRMSGDSGGHSGGHGHGGHNQSHGQGQGYGQGQGQGQGYGNNQGHQQQPQQQYNYGNEKPPAEPTKEEQKKDWRDLDDDRKKQLAVGGGLLAGAAAIAGGYFAFKEHEKSEEEKKAQTWALQNWIKDAEDRTRQFKQNGPSGPCTWVLTEGKNIPSGAIVGGEERGVNLYICRAFYDGAIIPGKAAPGMKLGGVLGYCDEEIDVPKYEVLIGDMRGLRWVQAHGRLDLRNLGAKPVEGGRENDGTHLYIAQAPHKGATHPGKASDKLDGAYIPYGGGEKRVDNYQVLCYA